VDVEGVLKPDAFEFNPHRRPWPWTWLLAALLATHPDVRIVTQSTWRRSTSEFELRTLMGPLGPRFLGGTPGPERYQSILDWLKQHSSVQHYRVLDDSPHEFPSELPELILCDPDEGVRTASAQEALRAWLEETQPALPPPSPLSWWRRLLQLIH
jgi:hypothetical protein